MLCKPTAWIVEHPKWRAWVTSALTILTSVSIAALIRCLAQGSKISWGDLWRSPYLYALLLFYVIYASIQSVAFKFDKKVANKIGKNNPYLYVERECLDEYAATCKKLLSEGKLEEYHESLSRLRGKDRVR